LEARGLTPAIEARGLTPITEESGTMKNGWRSLAAPAAVVAAGAIAAPAQA